MLKLSILGVSCLYTMGCRNINVETYMDKSLDDISCIAKRSNKPFCIVLVDSCQELSKEYSLYLHNDYKYLLNKSIYNFVNIRSLENTWYLKWLCPVSIPLTCVFSSDGKLIDLIPGAAKETFLYTNLALENRKITEYHWPNRFNINKTEVVSLLDSALLHKNLLKQGIYIKSELKEIANSLHYPYTEYLQLIGELKENDTLQAQYVAENLLKYETSYNLDLYKQEFITAKKVIDPDFDIDNEPTIEINDNTIYLYGCGVNKNVPLDISVHNKGNKPLEILAIHTSCSCLEQLNYITKDKLFIKGHDSIVIKFNFAANSSEEIYRDIFINSNAINMPIYHINVIANIKK